MTANLKTCILLESSVYFLYCMESCDCFSSNKNHCVDLKKKKKKKKKGTHIGGCIYLYLQDAQPSKVGAEMSRPVRKCTLPAHQYRPIAKAQGSLCNCAVSTCFLHTHASLSFKREVTKYFRHLTKPTKWHVRPAKTQIRLGIRPVWSESSLFARSKLGYLATHWAHSEDSDQTGRMPMLIWVFSRL